MDSSSDAQEALRQELRDERARIVTRLEALERSFADLVDAADLEPPDDEHDPDGTTAYERAQVTSLAAEARTRLAAIDRAIQGVEDITVCRSCGGPIALERVRALPGTPYCVECAASGGQARP